VLPLRLTHGDAASEVVREAPATVLARIRTAEGEGVLHDALADRNACALLYSAMADSRSYRTSNGAAVRAFSTRALGTPGREVNAVRWLSAEQSNTSVVLDDAFILKVFRRVEPGPNPDLEIARYLTERTEFRGIAPVTGGIELHSEAVPDTTLAMMQAFVPNRGDGWSWMRGLLGGYFDACLRLDLREDALPDAAETRFDSTRREPPATIAGPAAAALDAARQLGRRTAEFHLALAGERRDPAFAPVPITRGWLRELSAGFVHHAHEVLGLLHDRARLLPRAVAASAQEVLAIGSALIDRFTALDSIEPDAVRIRCHGDFHLGQVLRTEDDFILLDFEGEPLRTLAERRAKASPLKDVAGMLRSFDYAAHSAFIDAQAQRPELARIREPLVRAWEVRVSAAFLGAWLETSAGAPFLPRAEADLRSLLDGFLLDKAFYELRYELNNRPDWLAIPLHGIRALGAVTTDRKGGPLN
jgi:maltose alpha-D-glucosyltransferase/alpha-amylase